MPKRQTKKPKYDPEKDPSYVRCPHCKLLAERKYRKCDICYGDLPESLRNPPPAEPVGGFWTEDQLMDEQEVECDLDRTQGVVGAVKGFGTTSRPITVCSPCDHFCQLRTDRDGKLLQQVRKATGMLVEP